MNNFRNQLLSIENDTYTQIQLVQILELAASKLEINTISEMARMEGKSPNGIKNSKAYLKIKIGKQSFAVKGVRDNNLPF